MRIDLGDLTFNASQPDENGTYWYVTGLEGWDSPALRQELMNPTERHGAVVAQSMLDTRPMTLSGVVKAKGEAQFWEAYNRLLGQANNLFHTRRMRVYEIPPKRLDVIRGGEVRIEFVGVGSFTFEMPLTALDPVKYALDGAAKTYVVEPGEAITVTNAGNWPSLPIINTRTPGRFKARHQGQDAALSSGRESMRVDTVMDFRDRTVTWNGRNRYDDLTNESTWWNLQPGDNRIYNPPDDAPWWDPNTRARWRITYWDAWI